MFCVDLVPEQRVLEKGDHPCTCSQSPQGLGLSHSHRTDNTQPKRLTEKPRQSNLRFDDTDIGKSVRRSIASVDLPSNTILGVDHLQRSSNTVTKEEPISF